MAQRETWLQTDLMKPAQVQVLRGVMFSQDNQGDLVGVHVYDNGQPAQLSGTVLGYIVKDNGDTVTITGTLQENRAWIVLPANAYDVVGMIHIAIQLKANSTQTSPILTLGMCAVYVQRTQTGNIITPEYRILDVAAILEMIDDVNAATAAANAAAGNANTKAGLADTAATRADAAAAALENMDASASTLTPGSDATAQITTVSGHYRALFGIPKGDTGATGPAPQIASTVTTYQESSSGSTIPSGTWQNAIPNPLTQGMFLWIKTVVTYDTGDTLTQYGVSHQGLDGNGSVNSVNGVSPDANGNVTLPKDSAPTQDSTNLITSGAVYAADAAQDTQIAALKNDLGTVQNGLAYIVGDTNTTGAALPIGQFVYVKGHATIADGLRTVTAGIAANGSITTNNTDACPEGGLNALNSRRPKSGFKNITIPAGGSQSETVLFDTPFSAGTSYSVQITQADQYAYADLYFGSTDRSVNGFKLNGSSNRSASITLQVMWAAIPI